MYDTIVIGKGPAGISGAIYAARAGKNTLVIGKDAGTLGMVKKIENYYGLKKISGAKLFNAGIEQIKELGCDILDAEVFGISYNKVYDYSVTTNVGEYRAKTVLIAVGMVRNKVKIENLEAFEGKGVSYCAVCDGFFYRGKNVIVIGGGEYALSEAEHLNRVAKTVSVFTNGAKNVFNTDLPVNTKKIKAIKGMNTVSGVITEDSEEIDTDGIFIAAGMASGIDIAKKIGIIIENNKIITDKNGETNIKGIYAAGDCMSELMQIATAVSTGAVAGNSIGKLL